MLQLGAAAAQWQSSVVQNNRKVGGSIPTPPYVTLGTLAAPVYSLLCGALVIVRRRLAAASRTF